MITLITVQNTQNVLRVESLSADLVTQQIEALLDDIPLAAAKTGALGSVEIVEAVGNLARNFSFPLVVDPVMMSKHGARLISPEAEETLKRKLFPYAYLVTPNIPEAEVLTGMAIASETDMVCAAERLRNLGCRAVLIKGGHNRDAPTDVLVLDTDKPQRFEGERVYTRHTHGTGCTFSAAITAGLALGKTLQESIYTAKNFVQSALETAPGLGKGNGPLNHFAASG